MFYSDVKIGTEVEIVKETFVRGLFGFVVGFKQDGIVAVKVEKLGETYNIPSCELVLRPSHNRPTKAKEAGK